MGETKGDMQRMVGDQRGHGVSVQRYNSEKKDVKTPKSSTIQKDVRCGDAYEALEGPLLQV